MGDDLKQYDKAKNLQTITLKKLLSKIKAF